MECANCGKETGEDWKKLCVDCFKKASDDEKKKLKEVKSDNTVESIITQASYKIASAAIKLDAYANPEGWEYGKQRLHELAAEINKRIPR